MALKKSGGAGFRVLGSTGVRAATGVATRSEAGRATRAMARPRMCRAWRITMSLLGREGLPKTPGRSMDGDALPVGQVVGPVEDRLFVGHRVDRVGGRGVLGSHQHPRAVWRPELRDPGVLTA